MELFLGLMESREAVSSKTDLKKITNDKAISNLVACIRICGLSVFRNV